MFTYYYLTLCWPVTCAKKEGRTVVEEQMSFTAFSPGDYQKIYPISV
jgi:hypothetical protein